MVPRLDQRIPFPQPVSRDRPRDVVDRALAAHFLAYANGRQSVADFIRDDLPVRLLLRSASAPATSATTGWAAELAATAVADVVASIARRRCPDRLRPAGSFRQRCCRQSAGPRGARHRCWRLDR